MAIFLPSLEQCKLICEKNPAFVHKTLQVDGYEVDIFNYRLASISDFTQPIPEFPEINAFELRGLTFIGYKRYLMLNKFFRIGETSGWEEDILQQKEIKRIQNKLDGSLIRFIKLPNGKVVAKTKMGVDNIQAELANDFIQQHQNYNDFVNHTLEEGWAALFELVSPFNQVVLNYNETDLRLLQIRDEQFGEYWDIYNFSDVENHQIRCAEQIPVQLFDYFVEEKKNRKYFEGWVFTYADGQMAKFKTDWYDQQHKLIFQDLSRIDYQITAVLNETIDDVIAALDNTNVLKEYVIDNANKIRYYFNHTAKYIYELLEKWVVSKTLTKNDRKEFAITNKSNMYFSVLMSLFYYEDVEKIKQEQLVEKHLKEFIFKRIDSLSKAIEFSKHLDLHNKANVVEEGDN